MRPQRDSLRVFRHPSKGKTGVLGSSLADSNPPLKEWQNQFCLILRSIMVAFDDKSSLAYRVVAVDIS